MTCFLHLQYSQQRIFLLPKYLHTICTIIHNKIPKKSLADSRRGIDEQQQLVAYDALISLHTTLRETGLRENLVQDERETNFVLLDDRLDYISHCHIKLTRHLQKKNLSHIQKKPLENASFTAFVTHSQNVCVFKLLNAWPAEPWLCVVASLYHRSAILRQRKKMLFFSTQAIQQEVELLVVPFPMELRQIVS